MKLRRCGTLPTMLFAMVGASPPSLFMSCSHHAASDVLRARVGAKYKMFAGFGGGALAQARSLQHGVHVPELRISASAHGLPTPLQMTMVGAHRVSTRCAPTGQPRF